MGLAKIYGREIRETLFPEVREEDLPKISTKEVVIRAGEREIKEKALEDVMEEAFKPIEEKEYVDELKKKSQNENYFEEVLGKLRDNKVVSVLGARIHLVNNEYRKITPELEDKLYQIIGLYND